MFSLVFPLGVDCSAVENKEPGITFVPSTCCIPYQAVPGKSVCVRKEGFIPEVFAQLLVPFALGAPGTSLFLVLLAGCLEWLWDDIGES